MLLFGVLAIVGHFTAKVSGAVGEPELATALGEPSCRC